MSVEVRRVRDRAEADVAAALVEAVFGGEQGVRSPLGRDGQLRLVAVDDGSGAVLGTCTLAVEAALARLGSLVVARDARHRGYASALLAQAEREARAAGARRIRLNAQVAAEPLYDRAGYVRSGGTFVAEGIDHVAMEKALGDA